MVRRLYSVLPEIKAPTKQLTLSQKLKWTSVALVIFFVMGQIQLWGLASASQQQLAVYQTILASNIGTLITAGISPIVMASIILQLLVGAKILNIDLADTAGRAHFQGLQKLLAILFCFGEGLIYTMTPLITPVDGFFWLIALQISLGSLILLYLDELTSKWGIGSGISLFIAAGVSGAFFWQIFRPSISWIPSMVEGGILVSFLSSFDFILLIPILVAIIIFLIVVFAEGMHVNIPITMGHRGAGGRYPVKFLYVSNMPVILAFALFANIQLLGTFLAGIPYIGSLFSGFNLFGMSFPGISALTSVPSIGGLPLFQGIIIYGLTPTVLGTIFTALIYVVLFVLVCVVFGKFWVQMGGQSTEAVARQLQRSGMFIPGFRRDERVTIKILQRYIPPITILGSIFVALLAVFGDFALSSLASGTGILLTVGIVYRFYEEIAKDEVMNNSALLSKLIGGKK